MTTLQIIEQREVLGKDFKIYGDYENPLFLAKDVAEWIEHSNARMMLQSVDDDEKVVKNAYTLGGNQEFSPQVRGCSQVQNILCFQNKIFPAGAGVFLLVPQNKAQCSHFPRRCGAYKRILKEALTEMYSAFFIPF